MRKVILCAGHDAVFRGAHNERQGVYEYDYVSKFVDDFKIYASDKIPRDIEIIPLIIDNSEDITAYGQSLKLKAKRANKIEDLSLFIEIHLNSFSDKKVSGAEVLYDGIGNSAYRFCLNFSFNNALYFSFHMWRGIKRRKDLYLTRNIKASVVLAELFFISNDTDLITFSFRENYVKLIKMMAKSIVEWHHNVEVVI